MMHVVHYCYMEYRNNAPRVIAPCDLIGTREAAELLGISKPSLTRRIAAGMLHPLAQLDGPRGVFIFDRNDLKVNKNER